RWRRLRRNNIYHRDTEKTKTGSSLCLCVSVVNFLVHQFCRGFVQEPGNTPPMMRCNLGGVFFGIVLFFEDGADGFRFVGAGHQEDGVAGGEERAWEQGHAPLVELRRED